MRSIIKRRSVVANVFEVLAADHQEVKYILSQLETETASGARLTGNSREKLVERLIIEESKHEAVEEMHFWPAVRDRLSGGNELADHAIKQEDEGKLVLDQLMNADPSDPVFGQLIDTFIRAAREHISYEEEQVWPKLQAVLNSNEQDELGQNLEESKNTAPTRPHPHAPSSAGAQKAAGPVAGLVDRARDTLGDRG
jgi:hemerythrin-like domain-containing protein